MSQSASFYSIAPSDFLVIQNSDDKELDIAPFVKAYFTLEESFMALEFTIVKGQDEEAVSLLEEIFNPSSSFGGTDFSDIDIDTIDPERLEAMVMDDASVYYLAPDTITAISAILNKISESDIVANYDAAALNDNDIYPGKWNNDSSSDHRYNMLYIRDNFNELKSFFSKAAGEKDYIITYTDG